MAQGPGDQCPKRGPKSQQGHRLQGTILCCPQRSWLGRVPRGVSLCPGPCWMEEMPVAEWGPRRQESWGRNPGCRRQTSRKAGYPIRAQRSAGYRLYQTVSCGRAGPPLPDAPSVSCQRRAQRQHIVGAHKDLLEAGLMGYNILYSLVPLLKRVLNS